MRNDELLLERYGINAGTKWLSMSVEKSVSSTLLGALIQDGCIAGAFNMRSLFGQFIDRQHPSDLREDLADYVLATSDDPYQCMTPS